jgi:hypothetical protein
LALNDIAKPGEFQDGSPLKPNPAQRIGVKPILRIELAGALAPAWNFQKPNVTLC